VLDSLQQLRALALSLDDEIERLTLALRPPALDDLGLAEALRWYVHEWSAASAILVDLHMQGLAHERLRAVVETTLYRIMQEALTNIRKHAAATAVSLIVERRWNEVLAIIEDNGRGFDLEVIQHTGRAQHHFGLQGMAERVQLVGGWLDIESPPGTGTTLYVHIPHLLTDAV
jgi:signal transduction histidine kinase